jgi:hypothetical protein
LIHPLDYFLLIDESPKTGNWRADLERVLGVSDSWMAGFMAGFAEEQFAEDAMDYRQGFECGQAVLADLRRYESWGDRLAK